jgi:AraC-like DNA-binding protein
MDAEAQIAFVDIRMDGVGFSLAQPGSNFVMSGLTGPVSLCYLVRRGGLWLEVQWPRRLTTELPEGTIVGISGLIPHWLKSDPTKSAEGASPPRGDSLRPGLADHGGVQILIGHAPIEALAESTLVAGVSIIPPSAGLIWRRIWRAMEAAEEELTADPPAPGRDAAVRRHAEQMLLNIVRWLIARTADGTLDDLGALGDQRIMRALAIAARDPSDAWSVARMAQIAGMSRTAFATRFHALTGSTPLQSVIRTRLSRAAEELARMPASLDIVAANAGYGSAAAFIRAFKRLYGETPARWGAKHRHKI